MIRVVMLDSGPLGRITHPRANPEIWQWLRSLMVAGVEIVIPEIADYEVRRNLILEELGQSLDRLNQLQWVLTYMPLTTQAMLKAAELWAEARRHGLQTADPKELNGDVILAAQAIQAGAIVATENIGHLSRFVEAKSWQDIS